MNVPPTLFLRTAPPPASLDHLKAQAAPTPPGAPPAQLGGPRPPPQLASGRPKVGDAPAFGPAGVWLFMGLTLLLSLFQFPMATTITSMSTSRVPPQLKGTLVGSEHATFALAGLLGPTPGVAVLERAGLCGVATGAALVYLSLFVGWSCFGTPTPQAAGGEMESLLTKPATSAPAAAAPALRRKSPRRQQQPGD